jgi:serine/threonine-protein kinase
MGSYLLVIHKEGFHPVRCPVYVSRLARERIEVTLYRDGEIPRDFVQVPSGPFIFQGGRYDHFASPEEKKLTDDFFLAVFPVTCGEYLEFLNDIVRTDPWEAARRVPRESEEAGYYWPIEADGRYAIPNEEWLSNAPEELKTRARRLAQSPIDWEADWPVFGVSWEDATVFSAWYSRKNGILASLSHQEMWEKAARGADGRLFPSGNRSDAKFANEMGSFIPYQMPCPVDSFPIDESPTGVRGLCGNSADWCIDAVEGGRRRMLKGGSWVFRGLTALATHRKAITPEHVDRNLGFRLLVCPKARTR